MAIIEHNISLPNDNLGDPLREAFGNQNEMNAELYETKVDKVIGKGLSSNDYTNTEKTKLAGIENGAQVNVQSDVNQTDDTAPDYIKNFPSFEQFVSVCGFINYADTNTQTSPLSGFADTEIQLTNDGLGDKSNYTNKPFGVDSLFNTVTNKLKFSQLSIGDAVKIRVNLNVTTSVDNQTIDIYTILAEGESSERVLFIGKIFVKTAGSYDVTAFNGLYIDNEQERVTEARLLLKSNENSSIKITDFYLDTVRRNINVTTIEATIPVTDYSMFDFVKKGFGNTDVIGEAGDIYQGWVSEGVYCPIAIYDGSGDLDNSASFNIVTTQEF